MNTRPPQFDFSAKTHGELREAALALVQWDAPRIHAQPAADNKPDAEEARRAELVATLDRQLNELIRLRDAHRSTGGEAGDPHLPQLDQQVGQLAALKERVQSASSIATLSQLRAQVNETVHAASSTARGAETAVMAAGAGGMAAHAAAEARFAQRMDAIDRETAPVIAQSHKLADEADLRAKMLGLDTSKYTNQHKHLLQSAQKKRAKGDHIGALEDETLVAHNTADHWGAIANAETDPDKKAEAEAKAAEARRKAAELEEQLRKAREAEAEKEAAKAGKTFASDAEKSEWIKAQADNAMQDFTAKKVTLRDETGAHALHPEQTAARAKAAEEHASQSSIIGRADEPVMTQSASLKKAEVCKDSDQNRAKMEDKNRREDVDGDLLATTSSLAALSTAAKDQAKQAAATVVAQAGTGKTEDASAPDKPSVPTKTADAGKSSNAPTVG